MANYRPTHNGAGARALSRRAVCRARRHRKAVFRRGLGHFRSRQRRGHRAGASAVRRRAAATIRRATNRRRFTPPSPMPSTKNRLQTFACTSSIGPGATNMVTGAATGDGQPDAGAAAAGGYFRRADSSAGLAAAGKRTSRRTSRVNDCFQARLALLGSDQSPGTVDHRPARSDARADLARRDRRGHAGAAAGYADRSLRLSRRSCLKSASGTFRAIAPMSTSAAARRRVDSQRASSR